MIPGQGLIHRARTDAGLTLQQLADAAGVAKGTAHKAEQSPHPSVYILAKYGKALGLTLNVFYTGPDGTVTE